MAGQPECRTRVTCPIGLRRLYGLTQARFVPIGSVSSYTLLDDGTVTAGGVVSTDAELSDPKYTCSKTRSTSSASRTSRRIVSSKVIASEGAGFAEVVNAVSAKLTTAAMRAMNKAVASTSRRLPSLPAPS